MYMSLFELLFYIFTYVLGVCSNRVPPVKVLWAETTSVYVNIRAPLLYITYVLGVNSTRLPQQKVWWAETTSVYVTI